MRLWRRDAGRPAGPRLWRPDAGRPAARRWGAPFGLTPRGVLLVLVLFVLAAMAVYPLRQHAAQQGRIAQLRAKHDALAAENARLAREKARLADPAYVEQLAEHDFGLVHKGERQWVLTGRPPADPPPTTATASPPPKRSWYHNMWERMTAWAR